MVKIKTYILKQWYEWRGTLLFIAFLIPFKSIIADINPVPTGSMNPTILEGDAVLVNKLAYSLKVPFTLNHIKTWASPQRGDIVVCFSPDDDTRLVKRVIGIPGDTVAIRNKVVYLNGEPLPYSLPEETYTNQISEEFRPHAQFAEELLGGHKHPVMLLPIATLSDQEPIFLDENSYFVMGDNRDNSKDSRSFGVVNSERIVGRAEAIVASWDIVDTYLPRFKRFFSSLK